MPIVVDARPREDFLAWLKAEQAAEHPPEANASAPAASAPAAQ
jgi:heme/copper-type cytochrome/quinol oxidase subunit 2